MNVCKAVEAVHRAAPGYVTDWLWSGCWCLIVCVHVLRDISESVREVWSHTFDSSCGHIPLTLACLASHEHCSVPQT